MDTDVDDQAARLLELEHADMIAEFVEAFEAGNGGSLPTPAWSHMPGSSRSTVANIAACELEGATLAAALDSIRASSRHHDPAVRLPAQAAIAALAREYADTHSGLR